MPLSDEEKQQLDQLLGAPQGRPQSPGTLPPGIPTGQPYVSSRNVGGMRITFPPPASEVQRQIEADRAKRAMESETGVLTADQRDRVTIASEALRKVNAVRETLGITGAQLTNRTPLTVWKQTPNVVQNPFLAPDAKQLRTQFNSAADLLAMLRTGKQGEKTQVDRVIAEYNPGNFDDSKTVINRLNEMENEIRAFGSGKLKSPLDAKSSSQPSKGFKYLGVVK